MSSIMLSGDAGTKLNEIVVGLLGKQAKNQESNLVFEVHATKLNYTPIGNQWPKIWGEQQMHGIS